MSERPWTPRDASVDDLAEQRRLFNACFGKHKDVDTFRWKYHDNPHGAALAKLACNAAGEVVGAYAYVPRRFLRDGQPVTLMQASDAMVDPSARRQRIFTGLDDIVCAESGEAGVPWAFAYSGRLSYNGFLRNGWVELGHARIWRWRFASRRSLARKGRLGPLAARFAPLVDAAVLRRRNARLAEHGALVAALTRVQRFGPEADLLFDEAAPRRGLVGVRDSAWLNWRYVDTPTGRAECYALRSPDGQRTDGWLVAEFHDGHGFLVDLLARDDATRARLALAFTVLAHARGMQEATALVCDHHPLVGDLRDVGWEPARGDLAFRDTFPFIARACRADAPEGDLDLARWWLADGDRDAEHMSP